MAHTMIATKNKWFLSDEGATDVEFIKANEDLTPKGRIHKPVSSAEVLTKFREKAKSLGLKLVNEHGALLRKTYDKEGNLKGGNRYMYLADVENENKPDYTLSVGFRNFGDKTLAFSGMCSNRVFVCQNGCCSGIVKPSRMRHTIGNVNNELLDTKIGIIFERFIEDAPSIHRQISMLMDTPITDELVGKFVKKMIHNPYVGSANLVRMLEDLENPQFNDHRDNSMFRLLNACTKVTTHNIKNPSQGVLASRECNNLIMSLIDSSFKPLGDVIEAEEVEAE